MAIYGYIRLYMHHTYLALYSGLKQLILIFATCLDIPSSDDALAIADL